MNRRGFLAGLAAIAAGFKFGKAKPETDPYPFSHRMSLSGYGELEPSKVWTNPDTQSVWLLEYSEGGEWARVYPKPATGASAVTVRIPEAHWPVVGYDEV